MKLLLILALLGCAVIQAALLAVAPHRHFSDKHIAELIDKLGSDDFEVRDAAERRLVNIENADLLLRRAIKSNDAEVKRRAARILAIRMKQRLPQFAKQIKADGTTGRADLLADRIVLWQGEDNEECWGPLDQLSRRLVHLQRNTFKRVNSRMRERHFPAFNTFRSEPSLTIISDSNRAVKLVRNPQGNGEANPLFLARGYAIMPGVCHYVHGLLAASTDVLLLESFDGGFLVAGGNVHVRQCGHAVIVCDGSFVADRGIGGSLIVASGNVRVESAIDSVILAGGDVFVRDSLRNSTIHTTGDVTLRPVPYKWERLKNSEVKQRQKNAFGPIKFFDPASVGVAVEPVPHAVRVVRAEDGFAKAGLKLGDLVTQFDGQPVPSPDAFRRLLRRNYVLGDPFLLRVRRDGSWLNLSVSLKR